MGILVKHILKHSTGRLSFRRIIPVPLRPFCGGQSEYKVSLGPEGAVGFHTRYDAALTAYDALIARAQRQLAGAYDPLDGPRIAYLAELFRVEALAENDEARYSSEEKDLFAAVTADLADRGLVEAINWRGDPVRRWAEEQRETCEAMQHVYRDLRAVGDVDGMVRRWQEEAELLIEGAGLVVDPQSIEQFRQLCRALNDAGIKVCEVKLARLDGDDVPTPPEPQLPQVPARAPEPPKSTGRSIRLMDVYEGYATAQNLTPGVRQEWRGYIKRLVDYLGHDDVTRITVDNLLDWRDHLLREVLRNGKQRTPTTVRDKYITSVRAALTWAVEERLVPTNVAADITVRIPKKPKLRDRNFTDAEARAILTATFQPAPARMAESHARARRWIPWLCAYTGARVNEISQLRGEDVLEINGIWAIHITPEAGTVKTQEARTVPIHQHLIDQGFVAMVQAHGKEPIFYDASRQRVEADHNRHFKKVGERLAEWVRKDVGISDPDIKPNHAWRHTFKSMSYLYGIEERTVDAIQGHSPKTTGRSYGKPPLAALAAAIAKIPRFEVDER